MGFRLTDEEIAQRNEIAATVTAAGEALRLAVENFNDYLEAEWQEVQEAQSVYNAAVQVAQSFTIGIVDTRQDEFDSQPEAWRESEAGQAADGWLDEWAMEFDESDLECPDLLESPDVSVGQALSGLPNAAEEV